MPLTRLFTIELYVPPEVDAGWIRRPHPAGEPVSKLDSQGSSQKTVPWRFRTRFTSRRRSPPQSSFATQPPALGLSARSSPDWVSALFATSPGGVHSTRGRPTHRYVPSSGFLSLSTACSTARLGRPVPSCRHVQGSHHRSGASTPAAAEPSSSAGSCPLAVAGAALTQANLSCHAHTASTSRPSSASGRVARLRGLAEAALAPLFGFRSLQDQPSHPSRPGYPALIRPRRSPARPSHDLAVPR
jgi:hypothetical protein